MATFSGEQLCQFSVSLSLLNVGQPLNKNLLLKYRKLSHKSRSVLKKGYIHQENIADMMEVVSFCKYGGKKQGNVPNL